MITANKSIQSFLPLADFGRTGVFTEALLGRNSILLLCPFSRVQAAVTVYYLSKGRVSDFTQLGLCKVDSFIPSSVSPQKSQNSTTGDAASIFNISRGTATRATLKSVKCHGMQEKIVSAKKRKEHFTQ